MRTRDHVERLLEQGLTQAAIARTLDLSRGTIAYHMRNLGRPADARFSGRHDWGEIQRFYDLGHSISECQLRFGFSRETWNSTRERGLVVSRPQAMPLDQLLSGTARPRTSPGATGGGPGLELRRRG